MPHPIQVSPAGHFRRAASPRRFATGITAAAAVAAVILSTALPARAKPDGEDLAKALIAALVIGAIAHEVRGKDDPAPAPEPVHGTHRDDRPRPSPDDRNVIPRVCAISIEGERRTVEIYPESCLRDEGIRGPLPRECASRATIFGQPDRVYGAECLRDAGFRIRGGW